MGCGASQQTQQETSSKRREDHDDSRERTIEKTEENREKENTVNPKTPPSDSQAQESASEGCDVREEKIAAPPEQEDKNDDNGANKPNPDCSQPPAESPPTAPKHDSPKTNETELRKDPVPTEDNGLKLIFDFAPSTVEGGKPFEVAILLVNEEDEPQTELGGVEVILTAPGIRDMKKEVEGGEAVFSDVVINLAEGDPDSSTEWCFEASAEGVSGLAKSEPVSYTPLSTNSNSSANGGAVDRGTHPGGDVDDEEVTDAGILAERLKGSTTGGKMKHYLMLTKGRMWGKETNAASLASANIAAIVNDVLTRCDSDEAIEAIALIQELLSNPSGNIIYSCGACRATIRPDLATGVFPKAFKTPGGLVFHESCLLCQNCKTPVGSEPFVRNKKLQPFKYPTCFNAVAEDGQEWEDKEPLVCTPLDLSAGSEDPACFCEAVRQFLAAKDTFINGLKTQHYADEYVYERTMRMMARIPKALQQELEILRRTR